MFNFLRNLFRSNEQFRRESLAIVNRFEKNCEEMLVLAATIVNEEEKVKLIESIHKLQKENIDFKKILTR